MNVENLIISLICYFVTLVLCGMSFLCYKEYRSVISILYISFRLLIIPALLFFVASVTGISGEKILVSYPSFIVISCSTFDIVTPFLKWAIFYKKTRNEG